MKVYKQCGIKMLSYMQVLIIDDYIDDSGSCNNIVDDADKNKNNIIVPVIDNVYYHPSNFSWSRWANAVC